MPHRLVYRHLGGFLLALLIAPLAYMALLDNRNPATIHGYQIAGALVPGGKITITFDATVHRDCHGYARRRITGSNGIVFEYEALPTVVYDHAGSRRRFVRELELPISISAGEAIHDVRVYYYCNFVQRLLNRPIVLDRPQAKFMIR